LVAWRREDKRSHRSSPSGIPPRRPLTPPQVPEREREREEGGRQREGHRDLQLRDIRSQEGYRRGGGSVPPSASRRVFIQLRETLQTEVMEEEGSEQVVLLK
ncbi:hypothetical protein NQZ68_007558, partial [Dissostichus eleginoides]